MSVFSLLPDMDSLDTLIPSSKYNLNIDSILNILKDSIICKHDEKHIDFETLKTNLSKTDIDFPINKTALLSTLNMCTETFAFPNNETDISILSCLLFDSFHLFLSPFSNYFSVEDIMFSILTSVSYTLHFLDAQKKTKLDAINFLLAQDLKTENGYIPPKIATYGDVSKKNTVYKRIKKNVTQYHKPDKDYYNILSTDYGTEGKLEYAFLDFLPEYNRTLINNSYEPFCNITQSKAKSKEAAIRPFIRYLKKVEELKSEYLTRDISYKNSNSIESLLYYYKYERTFNYSFIYYFVDKCFNEDFYDNADNVYDFFNTLVSSPYIFIRDTFLSDAFIPYKPIANSSNKKKLESIAKRAQHVKRMNEEKSQKFNYISEILSLFEKSFLYLIIKLFGQSDSLKIIDSTLSIFLKNKDYLSTKSNIIFPLMLTEYEKFKRKNENRSIGSFSFLSDHILSFNTCMTYNLLYQTDNKSSTTQSSTVENNASYLFFYFYHIFLNTGVHFQNNSALSTANAKYNILFRIIQSKFIPIRPGSFNISSESEIEQIIEIVKSYYCIYDDTEITQNDSLLFDAVLKYCSLLDKYWNITLCNTTTNNDNTKEQLIPLLQSLIEKAKVINNYHCELFPNSYLYPYLFPIEASISTSYSKKNFIDIQGLDDLLKKLRSNK